MNVDLLTAPHHLQTSAKSQSQSSKINFALFVDCGI